ncbi:hypothetical protein APHAL10511_005423 [Amanita phalloides]|nr:hypothetical protein APHAL10511_005423 [Amanita phalloides]
MFSLADSSSDDDDDVYQSSVPFPSTPSPNDPIHPVPRAISSSVLVNGKPLKSSLKSSSSSPSILIPARTRSEPSTPLLTQKNVHFPEGDLVSVRVFNRSARPASLSKPTSDDTETETESEASAAWPASASYFRSLAASKPLRKVYELDPVRTSPIPRKHDHIANVHLESVHLKATGAVGFPPAVTGSILVRNVAYEKSVVVRFTLDDWQTTSEVSAHHAASLTGLPDTFVRAVAPVGFTLGDLAAKSPGWDRFAFTIKLEDHASNLDQKTMWLVVRYTVPTCPDDGGEWWDNNTGGNYRIAFRSTSATTAALPKLALPMMRSASASAATSLHQKFYSYPSSTATATATAAAAASSRLTFPVYHQQQQQYLQRQQQMYQQRRKQDEPPQPILPERPQVHVHHEQQSALAQTTLSRLKKLNLRNYAAPSPSTSPLTSPASSRRPSMSDATVPDMASTASSSPSSSCSGSGSGSGSSTETTPMSSPKTDFLGLGGLGLGLGLLSSEQRKGSYSPSGDIEFGLDMGMQFQDGAPATSVVLPISTTGMGMNDEWAMGLSTSPPFSMLSSQGSFVRRIKEPTLPPSTTTTTTTTATTTTTTMTTETTTATSSPAHPPRRVKRANTTTGRSLTSSFSSASSSSSSDTDRADRYRAHPRLPPPPPQQQQQDEVVEEEDEGLHTPRAPLSPASPCSHISLAINTSTLLDVIKEKSTSPGRRRRYHAFSSSGGGSSCSGGSMTRSRSSSSSSSSRSGSSSSSSNNSSDSENGTGNGNGDGAIYTRSSPSASALSLMRPQSPSASASSSSSAGNHGAPPSPPPPVPGSGTADSVYQAFVRQWCFAQGGPGSPGLGVIVR